MAGHSQFKNIMHRKGAQDAKRAKLFTKLLREITVAVKEGGGDPLSNARLRGTLASAREANMPKDNIDRSIKKALGGDDTADYVTMRYEGYGPGGVAVIVEALTDNRNRTAADIRSAFSKHGGAMGETNSVSFQFDHEGIIGFPLSVTSADAIFEAALEAGALDVTSDTVHEIKTSLENFHKVRDFLTEKFGHPTFAKIVWNAQTKVSLDQDTADNLYKLIDVLEDNDDVQQVFTNYDENHNPSFS